MRPRDRDGQFIRRPSRRVGEWFVSTVAIAVVAIAMPSGGCTDAADAAVRPNIILINADDLGKKSPVNGTSPSVARRMSGS